MNFFCATVILLCLLILIQQTATANVDQDFVDLSFECPAKAICPQLCVATTEDCPSQMQCGNNQTLCADGSCHSVCGPNLVSPCSYECAPVACPLVIQPYEDCKLLFASLYEHANTCHTSGPTLMESKYSWGDPAFLAIYVWVGGVTVAILGWCSYK